VRRKRNPHAPVTLPRLRGNGFANALLAIALAGQRGFDALLFARLQIKRMALSVLDDVFLQDFALKAAQSAFDRFSFLKMNLSQRTHPPSIFGRAQRTYACALLFHSRTTACACAFFFTRAQRLRLCAPFSPAHNGLTPVRFFFTSAQRLAPVRFFFTRAQRLTPVRSFFKRAQRLRLCAFFSNPQQIR